MGGALNFMPGASPIIQDQILVSNVPSSENPLCQVSLSPLGVLQTTEGGGGGIVTSRLPQWWGFPFASATDVGTGFQARLSVVSGSNPNGSSSPIDTWIDLNGSSVSWMLFRNTTGTSSGVWDISIRSRGTGTVLTTARYTLTCTKNP